MNPRGKFQNLDIRLHVCAWHFSSHEPEQIPRLRETLVRIRSIDEVTARLLHERSSWQHTRERWG